jgi:hypothetical protein
VPQRRTCSSRYWCVCAAKLRSLVAESLPRQIPQAGQPQQPFPEPIFIYRLVALPARAADGGSMFGYAGVRQGARGRCEAGDSEPPTGDSPLEGSGLCVLRMHGPPAALVVQSTDAASSCRAQTLLALGCSFIQSPSFKFPSTASYEAASGCRHDLLRRGCQPQRMRRRYNNARAAARSLQDV